MATSGSDPQPPEVPPTPDRRRRGLKPPRSGPSGQPHKRRTLRTGPPPGGTFTRQPRYDPTLFVEAAVRTFSLLQVTGGVVDAGQATCPDPGVSSTGEREA